MRESVVQCVLKQWGVSVGSSPPAAAPYLLRFNIARLILSFLEVLASRSHWLLVVHAYPETNQHGHDLLKSGGEA